MGRIDALISDPADELWILDHRVAWHGWASDDDLLGDLASLRAMWSVEQAYPQLKISGTIHSELVVDTEDPPRGSEGEAGGQAALPTVEGAGGARTSPGSSGAATSRSRRAARRATGAT